jgi:hypothetical protein
MTELLHIWRWALINISVFNLSMNTKDVHKLICLFKLLTICSKRELWIILLFSRTESENKCKCLLFFQSIHLYWMNYNIICGLSYNTECIHTNFLELFKMYFLLLDQLKKDGNSV